MSEKDLQNEIRLEVSKKLPHVKLFRNNVGNGFLGHVSGNVVTNFRRIKFGLHNGSGDLIGYTPTEITQEMVGKKVAIFTSIEVKIDSGKPTDEQLIWKENILKSGGIAAIVKSVHDAIEVLNAKYRF